MKRISQIYNIYETRGDNIDVNWLNSSKPVMTSDGRVVVITDIDYSKIPNIIKGKVEMSGKLYDYEWEDNGVCTKAVDMYGKKKEVGLESDRLVKGS